MKSENLNARKNTSDEVETKLPKTSTYKLHSKECSYTSSETVDSCLAWGNQPCNLLMAPPNEGKSLLL
jgi:hypothetical protein